LPRGAGLFKNAAEEGLDRGAGDAPRRGNLGNITGFNNAGRTRELRDEGGLPWQPCGDLAG
jgi:hypothetical protein